MADTMKIIAAATALAILAPTALAGQTVPPPADASTQEASGPARLAAALNSDAIHEASMRAVVRDMRTVMMRDPNIVLMERECEGIVDAIVSATTPFLIEYGDVERAVTKAEMKSLFENELTDEEASQLARFYESKNGQRILAGVNANLNFEQTIAGSVSGNPDDPVIIDEKDAEADARRTVAAMISGLSKQEMEEIGREFLAIPASGKLQTLTPEISALRLDIANRDLVPGFDARLDEAMETTVTSRLGACGL